MGIKLVALEEIKRTCEHYVRAIEERTQALIQFLERRRKFIEKMMMQYPEYARAFKFLIEIESKAYQILRTVSEAILMIYAKEE